MHHVFSRLGSMIAKEESSHSNTETKDATKNKEKEEKEKKEKKGKSEEKEGYRQHGLPVAVKLFNFAMQLIDVSGKNHADLFLDTSSLSRTKTTLRKRRAKHLGFDMLNMAMQSGGQYIVEIPSLLVSIQEDVCRAMVLACFDKNDDRLLGCALECFTHLIVQCRKYLKHQIGIFFVKVYLGKCFKAKESVHRVYGKHCRVDISIPPPSFKPVA